MKKKIYRGIISVFVILIIVVLSYVCYLFLNYHRIVDNLKLAVNNAQIEQINPNNQSKQNYRITTFNIGYAANPQNYSFFMDGGQYARGFSQANVQQNLQGIIHQLQQTASDFILVQEIDQTATRSYHLNEVKQMTHTLNDYAHVFALNYDSAYLFYPFTQPIGSAKSGLLTLSKTNLKESTRYSLPIAEDLSKFTDLDRAFTVTVVATEPKNLALINVHLSAFTKNQTIQEAQIQKLIKYMQFYRDKGYAVIVGGDYNHDLLGDTPKLFGTKQEQLTWTHAFPKDKLPADFTLVNQEVIEAKVPSVRANDRPYTKQSYVNLVDGFIVSKDIKVNHLKVWNYHFKYSDHNPVSMDFSIQ